MEFIKREYNLLPLPTIPSFSIKHIIYSFILSIILFFVITVVAFADIPIYCPKCKTHLYNYIEDKVIPGAIIRAVDFKPASRKIEQPKETDPMICPLCKAELNGWKYWASLGKVKSVTFVYPAFSLLTKEKNGKWKWVPYDVPGLENEVNTK